MEGKDRSQQKVWLQLGLLYGLLVPPRGRLGNAQALLHRLVLNSHRLWGRWCDAAITCAGLLGDGGSRRLAGAWGFAELRAGFQADNQHMFRGASVRRSTTFRVSYACGNDP